MQDVSVNKPVILKQVPPFQAEPCFVPLLRCVRSLGRVQLFATPWPECIIMKIFMTADNLTRQNYPHCVKSTTGYLDNNDGTAAEDKKRDILKSRKRVKYVQF